MVTTHCTSTDFTVIGEQIQSKNFHCIHCPTRKNIGDVKSQVAFARSFVVETLQIQQHAVYVNSLWIGSEISQSADRNEAIRKPRDWSYFHLTNTQTFNIRIALCTRKDGNRCSGHKLCHVIFPDSQFRRVYNQAKRICYLRFAELNNKLSNPNGVQSKWEDVPFDLVSESM